MKRQMIVIVLIVCLMNLSFIGCSHKSPVGNDPRQSPFPTTDDGTQAYHGNDSSISGVFGEPIAMAALIEPPPADALDLLVNEGFMTSEERDIFWDAYYNGIDEGEKSAILRIIFKILDAIKRNRKIQAGILYAAQEVIDWYCEQTSSPGGGSCLPSPGSYNIPLEQ